MTLLADLGLTPTQHAEVAQHDPDYVQAWLDQLEAAKAKTPVAWFLSGIRSGRLPGEPNTDAEKAKQVRLAETYVRNAGLYESSADYLLDGLFGERGRLRPWADDQVLRQRIADLWEHEQERVRRSEAELEARIAAYRKRREAKPDEEPGPSEDDEP
jgi:hypothetical protein